ncbi:MULTISPECIES: transposase family protein [Bacteroidaceae]|uniref:transposase family protein n=1 Tax=Bacteroidaceae TaxID=815 RepID=UPI00293F6D94|nr:MULTISPECIES: transposase family protein [Bacteroidaceae]
MSDPRINRKSVHSADTTIYISMAAVIHGAESRYEVEDFGNAKIDLFPRTVARIWNLPSVTIPLIVFSVL